MRFRELQEELSSADLDTAELFANKTLSKLNIEVYFTQHFREQINLPRNQPKINLAQLIRIFRQVKKQQHNRLKNLEPFIKLLIRDNKTKINIIVNIKKGSSEDKLLFSCTTIIRADNFGMDANETIFVEAVGRITKQNQTQDVGPDEVKKQAAKFGNTVDRDGRPPTLSKKTKGSKTNVLYNLSLAESVLYEKKESLNQDLEKNVDVDLRGNADRGYVLGKIKVPAAERDQGIGTEVMQQIINRMDSEGAVIALTPVTEFGGTKSKLIDFYKRFGFVFNKGRNKDYSFRETMIRYPRNKTESTQQTEAFDTEVEWVEVPAGDRTEYAAKVGEAYIELTYKPMDKGVYIQFTRGHSMGVSGEGLQNKIFGAVINHIQKWVAKNKPQEIYFQALKPGAVGSEDTARSKLYSKMLDRFASQNGYDYDIEDRGSNDIFILKRKQSNVEENFADGKKKGKSRPGRVKKAGASCKGSITDLKKRAKKYSGEKGKMYQWCLNMKSGRKKS